MRAFRTAGAGAVRAMITAFAALTACAPDPAPTGPLPPMAGEFKPVYLVKTALLEPPVVGDDEVFRPEVRVTIDPDDPAAGEAIGFYVTLAMAEDATVSVRLADLESADTVDLVPIDPHPSDATDDDETGLPPLDQAVRDRLRSGDGVFWIAATAVEGDPLNRRYAVLIPAELLPPFARLDFFASAGIDGAPVRGAQLDLADDFFYMAVIGDSVQWGNGLRESDKISSLVAEAIEAETGRWVIQQRFAQTGARIVPTEADAVCSVACNAEAPTASTSITLQADLIERPEVMDLVLMDGCINDVGTGAIIDPLTTEEELQALSRQFCRDEMARLIEKVHGLAPEARVVVTGYYPIVSLESDLFGLREWTTTRGLSSEQEGKELIEALAQRSDAFLEAAHAALRDAVQSANAAIPEGPRVAFADPAFGPQHAVFTEDRWLWSMTADDEFLQEVGIDLALAPEDQTVDSRTAACFHPDSVEDLLSCIYVSVGHPNPQGAQAYADAVVATLRELGVL